MRVITGTAKGRRLATLEGEDIRPTADKVKCAIFNSIQFDIEDRAVLDPFAGAGQLGIEALSRGAKRAVFLDINRSAVRIINQNLEHCRLKENASVLNGDGISYLKTTGERFDIIFLDPPYGKELVIKALPFAAKIANEGGVVVCETGADESLPSQVGSFTAVKESTYSKTKLTIYRYSEL